MREKVKRTNNYFLDYEDGWPSLTADEIIISDNNPIDTGLLTADGHKIYKYEDRVKIGFHK